MPTSQPKGPDDLNTLVTTFTSNVPMNNQAFDAVLARCKTLLASGKTHTRGGLSVTSAMDSYMDDQEEFIEVITVSFDSHYYELTAQDRSLYEVRHHAAKAPFADPGSATYLEGAAADKVLARLSEQLATDDWI